jgi:hypothetical protein
MALPKKEIIVPDRYNLRATDAIDLMKQAEGSGAEGMLDAIIIAYRMGFRSGCNYEKHLNKT